MKALKKSGRKSSIILLIIIGVLILVSSFFTVIPYELGIKDYKPVVNNISLGIDLKGGVYVVMEAVWPNDEAGNPVTQVVFDNTISGTIDVLQKRLVSKGYTEATVVRQGDKRLRIEIPDVENPDEIFSIIGKPAVLEFRDPDGMVILTGSKHILSSYPTQDENGTPAVGLTLNSEGTTLFSEATGRLIGKTIGIFLDDKEISSPNVSVQISNGKAIITNMRSAEEAQNLVLQLQSGTLPLDLNDIEQGTISPTLGAEALRGGLISGAIGLALIMLFMIIYYKGMGIAAAIALIMYTLLLLWVIAGAPIVFSLNIIPGTQMTLPGIAGIILSIGMAVDANVIIYERIKDEYRLGKTLDTSIKIGFKRASAAIIDSNVTTIFSAIILMLLGKGTIKSFGIVLLIGLLISFVCALVFTRIMLRLLYRIKPENAKFFGVKREEEIVPRGIFKKEEFKIVEHRKGLIIIPVIIISAGILISVIFGLNLGIDFTGGNIVNIQVGTKLNDTSEANSNYFTFTDTIKNSINSYAAEKGIAVDMGTVQLSGSKSSKGITFRYNVKGNYTSDEISAYNNGINDRIETDFKAKMADLSIEDTNYHYDIQTVGGVMSSELVLSAFWAVALSILVILIYLAFRFELLMGAASVIALVHDVLVMFAFVSIFRLQINSTFIAAMVTIVGYSINDSIVIFDRVRENLKRLSLRDATYAQIANKSMRETMMRSINTSLATLVSIVFLYILGVDAIKEFAFPIIVGIIAGAYSGIFLSTPIWVMLKTSYEKSKAKRAVKRKAVQSKEAKAN